MALAGSVSLTTGSMVALRSAFLDHIHVSPTHSGAVFSPYNLVASPYDPGGEPRIIKTGISLAPYIQASLATADRHADRCEATVTSSWEIIGGDIAAADVQEADKWEDLVEDLRLHSPRPPLPHGPPPRPILSSPQTTQPLPHSNNTAMPVLLPAGGIEIRCNKESTAARCARRRRSTATHSPFDKRPNLRYQHRALPPVLIDTLASALPHTKAAWLKGRGYRLIKWDGGHPLVIVDQDGRIVCVFVGKPDDPEWDTKVIPGAFRAMERASRKGLKSGALTELDRLHRRGNFLALTAGVSFGGGQKIPGNLVNSKPRRRILCALFRNKYICRIAGFQSSAFAYWAPKVYREYADVLRQLFENPDTVAAEHTDYGNNPAGWCAITSGGTSALVLSGAVNHGNTPIAADETRFSMTQYAVGGLFRWVRYGFMTAKVLLAQKGGKELRDAYDGLPLHRINEIVDRGVLKPTTLTSVGLAFNWDTIVDFCPDLVEADAFSIVDIHGPHEVNLDYCGCPTAASCGKQLKDARLYPLPWAEHDVINPDCAVTYEFVRFYEDNKSDMEGELSSDMGTEPEPSSQSTVRTQRPHNTNTAEGSASPASGTIRARRPTGQTVQKSFADPSSPTSDTIRARRPTSKPVQESSAGLSSPASSTIRARRPTAKPAQESSAGFVKRTIPSTRAGRDERTTTRRQSRASI
ncbi:hypothetical protein B0H17DRAFT_1205173 [Mycena rosella]|uniref:CxC2-like cysteine cluster KDZ transposase-associated domain-containing protein n=1 Tax=Mycena rosella TaxID=1033263 RepID=A0AAD7D7X5_MYCRO|nr:hypothetical protein B0H17DRAFT_1205173 [Mycena rosella]